VRSTTNRLRRVFFSVPDSRVLCANAGYEHSAISRPAALNVRLLAANPTVYVTFCPDAGERSHGQITAPIAQDEALPENVCATDFKLGHSATGGVDGLPLRGEFTAGGRPARWAAARNKHTGRLTAEQAADNATRTDHSK
jgi:hypothetical protein